MSVQYSIELAAFLFCAVVVLGLVARRAGFPVSILLVLAGVGLGLTPGFPAITIDPDVVFLGCLPPLLYSAAIRMPWHEFRANLVPISGLAIGLVLATTATVATAAYLVIPGMSIPAAAALGAIVAPTDAIAAVATSRRLGIPEHVVTIIEGESLVNDASGLVAYQFAVLAVVTGVFTWADVGARFLFAVGGGVALGFATGSAIVWLFRRIEDSAAQITLSLVLPFPIFLVAEQLDCSGVLAVVTTGLFVGRRGNEVYSARSRIDTNAVFGTIDYILNGVIFLLIGVQLQSILLGLGGWTTTQLIAYAALISSVVLGVRVLWSLPLNIPSRLAGTRVAALQPSLDWKERILVGGAGMRGVVSLAAALALPLYTQSGHPFPDRGLIIFLTATVVLTSLVMSGMTLPLLARGLGVEQDATQEEAEREAREMILRAPIGEFDRRMQENSLPLPIGDLVWIRELLANRLDFVTGEAWHADTRDSRVGALRFYAQLLGFERAELRRLFHSRKISKATFAKLEREIDLEDTRTRSQIGEETAASRKNVKKKEGSSRSP